MITQEHDSDLALTGVTLCRVNYVAQRIADAANVAYWMEMAQPEAAEYHINEVREEFKRLLNLIEERNAVLSDSDITKRHKP